VIAPDVNILIYAIDEDSSHHTYCRAWLHETLSSGRPLALSDIVQSGFLRIVTHPRILRNPAPIEKALAFIENLREHPAYVGLKPGARCWEIFSRLCRHINARGSDVTDTFVCHLTYEA